MSEALQVTFDKLLVQSVLTSSCHRLRLGSLRLHRLWQLSNYFAYRAC